MASKKDFSQVNTGRVYAAIAEATAAPEQLEAQQEQQAQEEQPKRNRKTYTPEKAAEMRAAGTTQGRKGCKATRINMAFTEPVHDYIKTMARVRGETFTQFVNYVFSQSMEQNAELYEKAKQFKATFK